VRFPRSSGVLLHPTSLPGRFGGGFGGAARDFVDFLAAARQGFWQIMPLGPPGHGGSPYTSTSAFAGNVDLISPEDLVAAGLLEPAEIDARVSGWDASDGGAVVTRKRELLERAFQRLKGRLADDAELRHDYERVREETAWWLDDYALYAAVKETHGGASWVTWDKAVAGRDPSALDHARRDLGDRVEAHRFFQYVFLRQWLALKDYANARGIRVIGDVPMFVAHDSADVWARRHLWKLDADGRPTVMAGVPPDAFSRTGQLWGNPLYDWDHLRAEGFGWWTDRMREALRLVDVVRLDHFRGFVACWEVPATESTAERGAWIEAPGRALLGAIVGKLGGEGPRIIAEDLGTITADVDALREEFGLPSMRVLQFAWSGDPHNPHLPHEYTRNVVAYTGTHDNDTVAGWFTHRSGHAATDGERRERAVCLRYLGTDGREIHWDFIRAVHMSVADLSIVPVQDVLGLGSTARMNTPGRADGNWSWRLAPGVLAGDVGDRLRAVSETYGRVSPA
jgi:4-alpha-glucanotransferase